VLHFTLLSRGRCSQIYTFTGKVLPVYTAAGFEVVTLIVFSHSASSEAQIRETVSDEAQKLRLRP
jgi:hypothetical protein